MFGKTTVTMGPIFESNTRKKLTAVVFVKTFHPAYISNIPNKAWKVITKDSYMKDVSPPISAFIQAGNSYLVYTEYALENQAT